MHKFESVDRLLESLSRSPLAQALAGRKPVSWEEDRIAVAQALEVSLAQQLLLRAMGCSQKMPDTTLLAQHYEKIRIEDQPFCATAEEARQKAHELVNMLSPAVQAAAAAANAPVKSRGWS